MNETRGGEEDVGGVLDHLGGGGVGFDVWDSLFWRYV